MTNLMEIGFKTEKRKLGDLLPANYNPRIMTEKQNKDLTESLTKFGLAELPVINTDNTIIAGHQRVRLLADIHGKDFEIEVRMPLSKMSVEDEKEYNIRSNKNTGKWDWDKLANEFDMTDLQNWGFEEWEIGGSTEEEVKSPKDEKEVSDTNTIKFKYDKDVYLEVLEKIAKVKKAQNLMSNEEALLFLLN